MGNSPVYVVQNPCDTFPGPGNYRIKLTVIDNVCHTNGTLTRDAYIKVREGHVSFTSTQDTVCQGTSVNFTSQVTGNVDSLFWSFGPAGATSNLPNPTYFYDSSGLWNVS